MTSDGAAAASLVGPVGWSVVSEGYKGKRNVKKLVYFVQTNQNPYIKDY